MQQAPSADLKRAEMLGDVEILPEPKDEPRPRGTAVWTVAFTATSFENYLHAACSACGQSSRIFNPTERASFAHCGKVERVPADVYQAYDDRLKNPESASVTASRRNTSGTVSYI
jgi:hypothetical protein